MSDYIATQPAFCEYYQQDKQLPELGNSYSSLFYILLCIYTLSFSTISRMNTTFLWVLGLTGVSSFLFHYTLWNVMGNMDVVSVLSLSYYGSFYCVDTLLEWNRSLTLFRPYILLCWIFAYESAISLWFIQSGTFPLYYLVLPPQLFVLLVVIYLNTKWNLLPIRVPIYANLGTLVLCISAIIPIYIDPGCSYPNLRTHTLWHIGSAYGVYLLFQAFLYIRCSSSTNSIRYRYDSYWFYIFPCIEEYINQLE